MEAQSQMHEWVSIRAARDLPGLRLVLLRGFPSPWSQAARALFELKKVPFSKVHRASEDHAAALAEWTGQDSFPAAMFEAERPRTGWAEILLLAERLQPEPALVPSDQQDRILMFGLAHEILGEMGLVWCRRLIGLEPHLTARANDPEVGRYSYQYGSSLQERASAADRVRSLLQMLARQLRHQRGAGSDYLVGQSVSAADLYWAVSSNLFAPLPSEALALPDSVRANLVSEAEPFHDALDPILLEHRKAIYARFLHLPIEL